VGRRPGVYCTWGECAKEVFGFSGARFKKFDTNAEAWAFVHQSTLSGQSSNYSIGSLTSPFVPPPGDVSVAHGGSSPATSLSQCSNTVYVLNYPKANCVGRINDDGNVQVGSANLTEEVERKDEGVQHDLDVKNKRSRESLEPVVQDAESLNENKDVLSLDAEEVETTERPAKKSKRHKTKDSSAKANKSKRRRDINKDIPSDTSSAQLESSTKAFFTSLNYNNPTAFTKLAETGFGIHELLSMKGLQASKVRTRFAILLGNEPQSAARIESLAFAVRRATEDVWNELVSRVDV